MAERGRPCLSLLGDLSPWPMFICVEFSGAFSGAFTDSDLEAFTGAFSGELVWARVGFKSPRLYSDIRLRVPFEVPRLFGLGVRSQKVSGTNKKRRTQQKPPTIATILILLELITECEVNLFLPKDPSPAVRLNDSRTDQRDKILPAKKE